MESNQPLVSVVMNCYNGEKYLKEAIDSIMTQTYQNWEIIFWDNQSTDKSANIVTLYNDKRIKYFYAPSHTPLGEARNLALSECSGEYIGFLDTDDIWLPNKLKLQVSIMESSLEFALCYTDFDKISADAKHLISYKTKHPSGYIFGKLLAWYEIGMPTAIVRSECLTSIGTPLFDQSMSFCPDYDLFMRIAANYKVCSIKESTAKYRVLGDSLTQKTKARHWKELLFSLFKLEGLYPELYAKYQTEFEHCYGWAAIIRADYLISIGDMKNAKKSLYEARKIGKKHLIKYLVSYLPYFLASKIYKRYFGLIPI